MRSFAAAAGAFLVVSGLFIAVALPVVAPTHQSAAFVFAHFNVGDMAMSNVPNVAYLFLLGMLTAQGESLGHCPWFLPFFYALGPSLLSWRTFTFL